MVKKMLARIGIGGALVDTHLETSTVAIGDSIHGQVEVRGGSVVQTIDSVDLVLNTTYTRRSSDNNTQVILCTLLRQPILAGLVILPGERQRLPFAAPLPLETPLTVGRQAVTVRTELKIAGSLDPTDHDDLEVTPHPAMQRAFAALHTLGFSLDDSRCGYSRSSDSQFPFTQVLEFRPYRSVPWRVGSVELVCRVDGPELEIIVDVDGGSRGTGRLHDVVADPRQPYTRMRVPHTIEQQRLADMLRAGIERSLG
jgi:sporulation-control protein